MRNAMQLAALVIASCASPGTARNGVVRVESERPLSPAEQALLIALGEEVGTPEVGARWIAHVAGAPVRIAEGWALDVQDGSAHAGTLGFRRVVVAKKTANIEWIEGKGASVYREAPLVTAVRRATVPRAEIDALIDPCAALATVSLEHRRRPGAPSGHIPIDTYLLVRLTDPLGHVVADRHHVGYAGTDALARVHLLEAATEDLLAYIGRISSWTTVQGPDARSCHLTPAFAANREVMTAEFGWFVEERSLEMLAQAGNKGAIPTLQWLAARAPAEPDRRARKIAVLLADPGRWLEGPPRDLEDAE